MAIATGETILASDVKAVFQTIDITYLSNDFGGFVSDVIAFFAGAGTIFFFHLPGSVPQKRLITSDWAAADIVNGAVLHGAYLYVLMSDNGTSSWRLYRYDKTDLSSGGTLMTLSGQTFGTIGAQIRVAADPSGNFYFTAQANNTSTDLHIISKYTLSGTTLTFVSSTTCGSTSANFTFLIWVDGNGNYYGYNTSDFMVRKYNSSGTLQTTSIGYAATGAAYILYNSTSNYIAFLSTAGVLKQVDLN